MELQDIKINYSGWITLCIHGLSILCWYYHATASC
jgi:hypothetical protein